MKLQQQMSTAYNSVTNDKVHSRQMTGQEKTESEKTKNVSNLKTVSSHEGTQRHNNKTITISNQKQKNKLLLQFTVHGFQTLSTGQCLQNFNAKVHLWKISNPKLHTLLIFLLYHDQSTMISHTQS